jgi:hypothetical protein
MNRPIRRGMCSLEIGIGRMKKRPEVRDKPIFDGWGRMCEGGGALSVELLSGADSTVVAISKRILCKRSPCRHSCNFYLCKLASLQVTIFPHFHPVSILRLQTAHPGHFMGTTSHLLQVTSLRSSSHASISWTVQLTLNGSITQPELPFRIPVDVQEEAEVFWYLENYTKSPFDADRAAKAVRLMKSYTASLIEQLHLEDVISGLKFQDSDEDQSILMVDVVETTKDSKGTHSRPSIQRVLWELLEQPSLWSTKVLVRRRLLLPNTPHSTSSTSQTGCLRLWKSLDSPSESHYSLNVLLVIARDLDPNKPEVDPTIGLKPLIALQDELREAVGVKPRLSLEIVRPGTYAALKKHLQIATMRHGKGYYHLVHFDMHGVLRTRSADKSNASSSTQYVLLIQQRGRLV